jgi:phosphonate transport system permease protein
MAHAIQTLPDHQASEMSAGYRRTLAARRNTTLVALAALIFFSLLAAFQAEVDLIKFFTNFGNLTNYVGRLFWLDNNAFVLTDPAEWFWGWKKWGRLLLETLMMAYLGTLAGAIFGFILCFVAAANLTPSAAPRMIARRALEFCRTVPELVFALIFLVAFGLGPLPGVIAIAIHTAGALGKQYAEVVENIDMKPIEGVKASGGAWLEQVRFGALPQVLSNFTSYTLLRFEINVRGASVMGFVGAGGIGHELITSIRRFQYSDISALLIIIVVTVMVIDFLTERLRHRFLRAEGAH